MVSGRGARVSRGMVHPRNQFWALQQHPRRRRCTQSYNATTCHLCAVRGSDGIQVHQARCTKLLQRLPTSGFRQQEGTPEINFRPRQGAPAAAATHTTTIQYGLHLCGGAKAAAQHTRHTPCIKRGSGAPTAKGRNHFVRRRRRRAQAAAS